MNIKTLTALVLCLTTSFAAAMEQTSWKPTTITSNALFIAIPTTNYKDSDEENSLSTERLSRTSAGSPLRTTQSGSPLLRLSQQNSARRTIVSPRIEQEMQENPRLSPKEKKLTPRSKLVYDYFGSDFFEESTLSSSSDGFLSPRNTGISKSTGFYPELRAQEAVAISSNDNAHKPIHHIVSPRNRRPNEITYGISHTDAAVVDGSIFIQQSFPDFFKEMEHVEEEGTPPTILLQLAMINNDYELVSRCLIEPGKNADQARKIALDAARDAAEKALAFSMAIQKDTFNKEKLQRDAHKAVIKALKARDAAACAGALAARPEAARLPLSILCNSPLPEDSFYYAVFKAREVVGLCSILLEAHRIKAKLGNEKAYLNTLSKINTAVWHAHQAQKEYAENIEEIFASIWLYIQTT